MPRIGYKKVVVRKGQEWGYRHAIVTLSIPDDAQIVKSLRSEYVDEDGKYRHYTKCRASKALVLKIEPVNRQMEPVEPEPDDRFFAEYGLALIINKGNRTMQYIDNESLFEYREGETVEPREPFDSNPETVCGSGIHFFETREEAERW